MIHIISIVKGELYLFLKKKINIYFSYFIIRFPFLKVNYKIRVSCIETLRGLNDYDIKRIGLGNDKGDLALKIIKGIRPTDQNMIEKLIWLISYDRYKSFSLNHLIDYLKKHDLEIRDLKYLINVIPNPFAYYGDYERFELIMLWLRKELDKKLNRKIGIYNESAFFTAIGHMSQLVTLLKAIELKIINKDDTHLSFAITNTPIGNLEYSKLLIEKCDQMGITIINHKCSYLDLEPNLELWPTNCRNEYSYARHIFGLIDGCWELNYGKQFIMPKEEQIEIARDILTKNYGKAPKSFVGIHFRIAKDSKTLRNTVKSTANHAISTLNNKGIKCILIGTKSNIIQHSKKSLYNLNESSNSWDTTKLKLSRYERECLQLFVWSKSRFFVGSLSGGTMPAMTFGTPTIWLDVHPQTHVRLPSKHDHIIPKRVFFKKENRFLNFNELIKEEHIAAQSENSSYVKEKGYKVVSCDKEVIKQSIDDMCLKTSNSNKIEDWRDLDKTSYLNSMKEILQKGKYIKGEYGGKYYF
tara:strand:+ start:1654 stop:3231 length:1578 start_codon:yes stop_codon:yes gene_type:complete